MNLIIIFEKLFNNILQIFFTELKCVQKICIFKIANEEKRFYFEFCKQELKILSSQLLKLEFC